MKLPRKEQIDIAELYQEHSNALYRFISAKLSSSDAADLMHDTFLRVLCLANGYELRRPRPFLFRVAHNLVLDHLKASRSSGHDPCNGDEHLPQQTHHITPEISVYDQQRLRVMQLAIAELPPRCKEVFLLYKFEHCSHKTIARRLGISTSMVEKHVIRALSHCRKRLAELE